MFTYLLEGLTTVCDYNLPSISFKTKFRQNIIMNNIKLKTLGLKIAKPSYSKWWDDEVHKKLHMSNNPYNYATMSM